MSGPRRCEECPTILSRYNPGPRCARCEARAELAKGYTGRNRIALEPYLDGRGRGRRKRTEAQTRARRQTVNGARASRSTSDFGATRGCAPAGDTAQ